MGMLNQIVELLEDRKIFVRQRTNHETKVIALLVYHAGLSYRKTSKIIGNLEPFSYEALRKWYKKCVTFFHPKKKQRKIIAVDETKVKLEGRIRPCAPFTNTDTNSRSNPWKSHTSCINSCTVHT